MIFDFLLLCGLLCLILSIMAVVAERTELGSGLEDLIRGEMPTDNELEN